ncbi:hypothetical protein J31TS4_44590 [Paenibacillus sp. J31TS4]|uniref:staygreen family protein n=1 Tax=Paenibacillus sp. J31TS4 TaxID=2807195 RepID=UPI001B2AD859|nr:staygreen family protein [Paenibacillus sp. J31TS4]GIP41179.1 hypothetical protein J31TS4_44590 [Paenibacillus sp. J31TS4]
MLTNPPGSVEIEVRDGATPADPLGGRRYTLTHSDETGELFLVIGRRFAADRLTEKRDEVLGEWTLYGQQPVLLIQLYIGDGPEPEKQRRLQAFRRELPLALRVIRQGDAPFYAHYPSLCLAPLWVHYESADPVYNRVETWPPLDS